MTGAIRKCDFAAFSKNPNKFGFSLSFHYICIASRDACKKRIGNVQTSDQTIITGYQP